MTPGTLPIMWTGLYDRLPDANNKNGGIKSDTLSTMATHYRICQSRPLQSRSFSPRKQQIQHEKEKLTASFRAALFSATVKFRTVSGYLTELIKASRRRQRQQFGRSCAVLRRRNIVNCRGHLS